MKDLINDEEEEDGSGSSSGSSSSSSEGESEPEGGDKKEPNKKKRHHDDFDDNLEDEDYDLLEENLGVKVQRKKKLKRVVLDDESDGEGEPNKDQIAQELFEGDEEGEDEERERPPQ